MPISSPSAAMPASRSSIRPKPSPASAARLVGRPEHHGIDCPDHHRSRHLRVRIGERRLPALQCGSYIFMDADYGRNRDRDGEPTKAFEPSLFVWATVTSRPAEDRAIVDAGLKALAVDSGP